MQRGQRQRPAVRPVDPFGNQFLLCPSLPAPHGRVGRQYECVLLPKAKQHPWNLARRLWLQGTVALPKQYCALALLLSEDLPPCVLSDFREALNRVRRLAGRGKKSLTPPPVAPQSSFHTHSSKVAPLTFPTVVPPQESTQGSLPGYWTWALPSPTFESEPVSPEAIQTVTPCMAGTALLWDRQFGVLKEILVAPIPWMQIMVGRTLGGATVAMCQGTITFLICLAAGFRPINWSTMPLAILLMLLMAIGFTALGVSIGCSLKSMPGFQLVMNFVVMPMFFLSGALFPDLSISAGGRIYFASVLKKHIRLRVDNRH